jgi:hypothetical protein
MNQQYNQRQFELLPEFEKIVNEYAEALFPELEFELTGQAGSVSRNNPDYIKWIQVTLNQVLGLMLPVNGKMGPVTRSAIKSFQKQKKIKVTGIVNSDTEKALGASLKKSPMELALPPDVPGKTITGKLCKSSKKCWDGPRSFDIIDEDIPINGSANRTAANYKKIIEYFHVSTNDDRHIVENYRYMRTTNSTWCNIYVHDVTRAMYANIPHWVKNAKGDYNEISANTIVDHLSKGGRWEKGNEIGWFEIDKNFVTWLTSTSFSNITRTNPVDNFLTKNIKDVALNILVDPMIQKQYLQQPAYVAQQFANKGLPTVIGWRNWNKSWKDKNGNVHECRSRNRKGELVITYCPGHVAMIRPEDFAKLFSDPKYITERFYPGSNVFHPLSAQAGSRNFENKRTIFSKRQIQTGEAKFFIHE